MAFADPAADIAALLEKLPALKEECRADIKHRAATFAWYLTFVGGTEGPRAPARLRRKGSAAGLEELRTLEIAAKALWEAVDGLGAEARASLDDAVAAYNREPRDGLGVFSRYPNIFELSDAVALLVIEPGQLIERARQGVTEKDAPPPPKRSARHGEALAEYALREHAHFTGTPLEYSKQAKGFVEDIFRIANCDDSADHSLRRVVKRLFAAD